MFDNKLPKELKITWNVHLKTTAGLTYYERKLVDNEDLPRHDNRCTIRPNCIDSPLDDSGLAIENRALLNAHKSVT